MAVVKAVRAATRPRREGSLEPLACLPVGLQRPVGPLLSHHLVRVYEYS
jgi:hypothetical protein